MENALWFYDTPNLPYRFYDTPNLPYRKCACRNRVIVMAKDDYFVIVYKILAYLYARLKKGEPVEAEMLMYDGGLFQINREYWVYIIDNILEQGYIKGLHNVRAGNGYYIKEQLSNCSITPKGIDYLCENSLLEKAKQFLKDVKEITPFI